MTEKKAHNKQNDDTKAKQKGKKTKENTANSNGLRRLRIRWALGPGRVRPGLARGRKAQ